MLHVSLNSDASRFVAKGGATQGKDKINQVVSTWPGWSRVAAASRAVNGSTYAGPASAISALALSNTSLELRWEEAARDRAGVLLRELERARAILEGRDAGSPVRIKRWPASRKPRHFQAQGVAAMAVLGGRCWLNDDMGLGKTSQSLWLGYELEASRVLVVCPSSVKFNWQGEVLETLGPTWLTQVINGTARQRANQFAELSALWQEHERLIVIINYDLLARLTEDQARRLRRFARDQLVILDEAHYLKNHKSERTKLVRDWLCPAEGGARWRVAVTGTPIRNTVDDVYSQVELIRPGTFHSFHWFLNRFAVQSTLRVGKDRKVRVKKTRRVKNAAELNAILNTFQVRRKKEDVTDLPPRVYTYPELELDAHTKKVYAAMRDYALLLLEEHDDDLPVLSPTCKTAVEAAARCEQITQGCVGGIPGDLVSKLSGTLARHAEAVAGKDGWLVFPKSAKLLWLLEQLETVRQQGGRSVVFCRFNAPLMWLQQRHEDYEQGVCVTGAMSSERREEVFADFQAGEIQELYIQVRIAEGFNLHRAQDEFFLGRDWAWAVNAQAVDRCHRIGQTGTVNVQMPFVRSTIEVRQHRSLAEKERDADNTLCFKTIADLKEALA